jgi:hypothetical protein
LRLIFYEILKFEKLVKRPETKLDHWMCYFAGKKGREMEQIAERESLIAEALAAERLFVMDRETRLAYMQEWKHILDEEAVQQEREIAQQEREAERRAREIAQQERDAALQERDVARLAWQKAESKAREAEAAGKAEVARALLDKNTPLEFIREVTGLSEDEIKKLS